MRFSLTNYKVSFFVRERIYIYFFGKQHIINIYSITLYIYSIFER